MHKTQFVLLIYKNTVDQDERDTTRHTICSIDQENMIVLYVSETLIQNEFLDFWNVCLRQRQNDTTQRRFVMCVNTGEYIS